MADEKKPEERRRAPFGAARSGGEKGGGAAAGGPGGGPGAGGKKQYFRRKKVCKFCVEKIDNINYKEVRLISSFVGERGRIIPRRISGVCTPHQRQLSDAIKKARNIALLPFAAEL
ncbi:MAG: 30S ribosomal protein S18 [Acidobacteria bacterium]|nr:30S ribosomal protein S18 [Acidobacteriota bacterium]